MIVESYVERRAYFAQQRGLHKTPCHALAPLIFPQNQFLNLAGPGAFHTRIMARIAADVAPAGKYKWLHKEDNDNMLHVMQQRKKMMR